MLTIEGSWALEATTDCVLLLDRDFRVVYLNRRAADLNRTTPEAIVGRLHGEVWPQTVGTEVERRYRHVLETGEPQQFDFRYAEANGFGIWHEIHALPHAGRVVVFYRDITERVRREQTLDRERSNLAHALDASGIGVWRRDLGPGGEIVWSPRMRAHFGLAPDEGVHADTFDAHVHPDDLPRALAAYREAVDSGRPYDCVYRTRGADGRERSIHARGRATYDENGKATRFDGFTLDITQRQETERSLGEAKAQLDALLAAVDIGAWRLDVATDTLSADAKALAMFDLTGTPNEPLAATVFRERVMPEDLRSLMAARLAHRHQDRVWNVDFRVARGGSIHWMNARGVPEVDDSGALARASGVVVDITEMKNASERLRETEARQRFRVELMDALRGQDDALEIVAVACRMIGNFFGASRATFGVVREETETIDTFSPYAKGVTPLEGAFSFEDYGRGLLEEVGKGRLIVVDDAATDPLTRDRYESVYAPLDIRSFVIVPLLRGTTLAATFAIHDRAVRTWRPEERELAENVASRTWDSLQRAWAEDRLRALNAELEDRVRERTAELEAFTSAVSHDLRGPLRNIHGIGKMLLEDAADRLNDDDRRMLDRQAHNALRLTQMVDALLGLARLGREPLNAAPFSFSELAESVAEDVLAREPDSKCKIVVEPDVSAVGDRRLIRSVLQNLVENACKFSPEGGTVRVARDAEGAYFVSDEGVGFDMAYAAKLFQPFERLVSEKQFPGTGIGLATVRRIVERHGGRVWAESTPGQGATFRLTLNESAL